MRDFFLVMKLFLYSFFGDYESGAKHALSFRGRLQKDAPGSVYTRLDAYHSALSLLAMGRKTKQRKYKKAAKRIMRQINGWVLQGDPNAKHFNTLLVAEMAALKGRKEEADKKYQDAVIFAARGGFVHDAALASERYAIFLAEDMQDREEASYRMKQASKYYYDWGAHGKVRSIQETHSDLLKIGGLLSTLSMR